MMEHTRIEIGKKYIDLVCGMEVDSSSDIRAEHLSQEYFFCSEHCKKTFLKNPNEYLEMDQKKVESRSPFKTYFPLLLILFYLVGGTFLFEVNTGDFDPMRMMRH